MKIQNNVTSEKLATGCNITIDKLANPPTIIPGWMLPYVEEAEELKKRVDALEKRVRTLEKEIILLIWAIAAAAAAAVAAVLLVCM